MGGKRQNGSNEEPLSGTDFLSLWCENHSDETVRRINLWLIVGMVICAVFDYPFFGTLERYTPLRAIPILVSALAIFGLRQNKEIRKQRFSLIDHALLSSSIVVLNILYQYYLLIAPAADLNTVIFGNLMVASFTSIVIFRFRAVQATLFVLCGGSALLMAAAYPQLKDPFLLVGICHAVTFSLSFHLRSEVKKELKERFQTLQNIVPRRVARAATVGDTRESFEPRLRYSVCLSADWRNYQGLTRHLSPKDLTHCFNLFFTPAIKLLQATNPSETFFPSWTADELFVVFYHEGDDPNVVMTNALKFTRTFVTSFAETIQAEMPFELRYDVGIASGLGIVGFHGPEGLKRTTVTGEHAGIAKRLQTEAKAQRQNNETLTKAPILILDQDLAQFGMKSHLFGFNELTETHVSHSDLPIEKKFYRFNNQDADISSARVIRKK